MLAIEGDKKTAIFLKRIFLGQAKRYLLELRSIANTVMPTFTTRLSPESDHQGRNYAV
ncbi:hypothetical protein Enr8_27090 [Blastopirellula retiformator]|uniref:Uncharacterized protein n=1 Tax=Blastopirellula retiformator TaxID=2527970 RepID=A0A5C5V586_9BACT|nr:hypothetical protein Enr8_27090 [Blastopirellula retiformator]